VGKKRARKRLRELIKSSIHIRKNARVLCFPGEYGTEIEDVYRKLGFRDCNIIGVERDARAAEEIQKRYPDIQVYRGDLVDFVKTYEGEPLSVVSLDYCGKATMDKYNPLMGLALKGVLAKRYLLHFNVMAGRELESTQSLLRVNYAHKLIEREGLKGKYFDPNDPDDATGKSFKAALAQASEAPLMEARGNAITQRLLSVVGHEVPAMLTCYRWNLNADEEAVEAMPQWVLDFAGMDAPLENEHPASLASLVKNRAFQDVNAHLAGSGVIDALKEHTRKTQRGFPLDWIDYHFGRGLVMLFFDKHGNAHLPSKMDRYSYVSESGKRMMTDLIVFEQTFDRLQSIEDAVAPLPDPEWGTHVFAPIFPNDLDAPDDDMLLAWGLSLRKKYLKYIRRMESGFQTINSWPDRIDLGGGTVTMTEEQVKGKIIGYIKQGRDNEYILRKFPTFKKGSLAAIRAHVTMGTY
jgi:hypothetical protein